MKRLLTKKFMPATAIALVVASFIFFAPRQSQAFLGINMTQFDLPRVLSELKDAAANVVEKTAKYSFLSSLRSIVNQFAYDTATYLGSGGHGQKPLYFTKEVGPWLREQGDNALGGFVEDFTVALNKSDDKDLIENFNICSPNLAVSMKISLGLVDFSSKSGGLKKSQCTIKQIFENGQNQIDLYKREDYLKNLAITAFEPTSSDVGAALTLFDLIETSKYQEEDDKKLQRQENEGWLNITSLVKGNILAPPGTPLLKLQDAKDLQKGNFWDRTGDIFVDAANIFLNQLAMSAFNKLIDNLSNNNNSSSSSNNFYSQGTSGGITEVAQRNSSILQAKFNQRADYNILSQLTSCKDENNPGPTECVINQQFAQAIEQNLTVAEAVNLGLLNGGARLGYKAEGNVMSYTEGYPYRSLVILRTNRAIPVAWEIAAQYIKGHLEETKDVTLSDLIACYSPNDISYPGYYAAWCKGLIDPHWVLKLPKMFCGMEGYGAQIFGANVFKTSTPDPENPDAPETFDVSVARNNTYCADQQSCIKENPNGSCDKYGYCTEEKRKWVFNQGSDNSCQPINNTCQTFQSETGQEASFLENTLDYDNCDASQVGCKQYAIQGAYEAATKKIVWDEDGAQNYFNKNITTCEASGEGCHQFIRTKDNLDTNIIPDASFEDSTCIDNGGSFYEGDCEISQVNAGGRADVYTLAAPNNRWFIVQNEPGVIAGVVQTQAFDGTQSLYVRGAGGLFNQLPGQGVIAYSFLPANFKMEEGHYYTLSAMVYVKAGSAYAGFGADGINHIESTATNTWQRLSVTYYKPFGSTAPDNFFVSGRANSEIYIDSVKLTPGRANTTYNDYGSSNIIYQKFLPAYLEATCYETGGRIAFRLKDDAPEECKKFAKRCNADEVGCESYTSLDSGITLTAKTTAQDYCPGSCVGYNTFVQQANVFNPKQAAYFIPSTARTCGAQSVGCTAFTNLDKLEQGGEAIEYYSAMRKCIKPSTTLCLPFYTWEGSDESGYQLKVYSLQNNQNSRLGNEPLSTLSGTEEDLVCNETIFRKLPTDPGYNYDCRQFYAQDGTVSYHLYEKTISCSDDCHPYRRELNSSSSCEAGGGEWDSSQSRCLYYAIPGEGSTCSASEAGCMEYTGNIANNTRNVFTVSTFENNDNPLEGWGDPQFISRSNTALNLGGRSLSGSSFSKEVGEGVRINKSYTLSFLAKATSATTVSNIDLINANGDISLFTATGTNIQTEWKSYSFNLGALTHTVTPSGGGAGEKLRLSFSNPIFIDNIRLVEVPNRYFVIKNSWVTPDECDEDFSGALSPGYMLGCSQYKTADSTTLNLHSFTDLCDDASAGCEAMIDTYNSTSYKAEIINDDNNNGITEPTDNNGVCDPGEESCIRTPADTMINVIYDRKNQCGAANKGCQRMGLATSYDGATSFSDIYINNNPDRYSTSVCTKEAVGCSMWTSPEGNSYFKDPGKEVCEWRIIAGSNNQYAWYKKDLKRCTGSVNSICTSNADCPTSETCQDVQCTATYNKTVGPGGKGNSVTQPSEWAGLCRAEEASCSEYIDPISRFNENLIINPSFKQTDTSSSVIEGWTRVDPNNATQQISLTRQTMYILKGAFFASDNRGPRARVRLTCAGVEMKVLAENNEFVNQSLIDYNNDQNSSAQFYLPFANQNAVYSPVSCTLTLNRTPLEVNKDETVFLLRANVDYQLAKNLDKTSHNNLVNFDKGAVLFNERSQNGKTKAALTYNADVTYDTSIDGASPSTRNVHNANVLLKVRPDRTCSKWLDCISYIPDASNPNNKICLDVGECETFAPDGSCAVRVLSDRENQGSDTALFANLSGYSKVGYRDGTFNALADYYNISSMTQVGEKVEVPNGDMESDNSVWGAGSKILSNPSEISDAALNSLQKISSQQRGVNYLVPEGKNILSLDADDINARPAVIEAKSATPLTFEVNKRYVLTLYTYGKGGDLNIGLQPDGISTNPIEYILKIPKIDHPHQWVKRSVGFKATSASYALIFDHVNSSEHYFIDDVKIESALNFRCSDPSASPPACNVPTLNPSDPQPQYQGPSCRLYPTENALSCAHRDENNITTKGLKGYCLEYDPRNPAVCLLWYPVDRIASDPLEEGAGVDFEGKDVYYCLDAKDQCSIDSPEKSELYCDKFVKVNTDYYWAARLAENSSVKLPDDDKFPTDPFFYASDDRKIDFGGSIGAVNIPPLPRRTTDNYFGAMATDTDLLNSTLKKRVTVTPTSPYKINSFLPYYGTLGGEKCPDNRRYYFVNNTDYYVPTYSYGVQFEEDKYQMSLGDWDKCIIGSAVQAELEDSACSDHGTCNFSGIDDIVEIAQHGSSAFCPLGANWCDSGGERYTKCKVFQNGRSWTGETEDTGGGGIGDDTEALCVFYCYNQVKEVSVTKPSIGTSNSLKVIKRLFPRFTSWNQYKWNGSLYTDFSALPSLSEMPECRDGVRPPVNGYTDEDYCYIRPEISKFTVNGNSATPPTSLLMIDGVRSFIVNGSDYIDFSFFTRTDPEQKPLREMIISMGYNNGNGVVKHSYPRGNYADLNPRYFSTWYSYNVISAYPDENQAYYKDQRSQCNGADECYWLEPNVIIKDNWDKWDDLNQNHSTEKIRIIVKPPT